MPKWITSPPERSIAAGIASRRSMMAEAPRTRTISQPRPRSASMASRDGRLVVVADKVVRRARCRGPPAAPASSRRSCRAWTGFTPGSRVCTRPDRFLREMPPRGSAALLPPRSRRRLRTASCGAANGMILIVATIWRGSTGACGGRVATVIASSTRFRRSSRAASTTATPALRRVQVDAAGERGADDEAVAAHRRRDRGRRLVLRHVAGVEPRRGDRGDAGRRERGDIGGRQDAALLERRRTDAQRVRENGACWPRRLE